MHHKQTGAEELRLVCVTREICVVVAKEALIVNVHRDVLVIGSERGKHN
jgi:hypothetical protein